MHGFYAVLAAAAGDGYYPYGAGSYTYRYRACAQEMRSQAFEPTNRRLDHDIQYLAIATAAKVHRVCGDNREHLTLAALVRGWREQKSKKRCYKQNSMPQAAIIPLWT